MEDWKRIGNGSRGWRVVVGQPEVNFRFGGSVDRNSVPLEGGDIVFVPRFHVAKLVVEVGSVQLAREFSTARAEMVPVVARVRNAGRARGKSAPTGDGVGLVRRGWGRVVFGRG